MKKQLSEFPEPLYFIRVVGTTDLFIHYELFHGRHSFITKTGHVGAAAWIKKKGLECIELLNEHGAHTYELVPCADVIANDLPQA